MKLSTIAAVGAGLALSLLAVSAASAYPILHAYPPVHHFFPGPWVPGWGLGYAHYWGPGYGYGPGFYGHGYYGHGDWGHGYWGHRWFHRW